MFDIEPIYPEIIEPTFERKFYKNNKSDKIWWLDTSDRCGEWVFSFDKITTFNMFADYPYKLTPAQKQIFDEENPYWKDFFADRNNEMIMMSPELYIESHLHDSIEQLIIERNELMRDISHYEKTKEKADPDIICMPSPETIYLWNLEVVAGICELIKMKIDLKNNPPEFDIEDELPFN